MLSNVRSDNSIIRKYAKLLADKFVNAKGVIQGRQVLRAFDLKMVYGVDPEPLVNFRTGNDGTSDALDFLAHDVSLDFCVLHDLFLVQLSLIKKQKLLGRETGAKLAYLKDEMGRPFRELNSSEVSSSLPRLSDLVAAVERTSQLLTTRLQNASHIRHCDQVHEISGTVRKILLRLELLSLMRVEPSSTNEAFAELYRDEIASLIQRFADVEPIAHKMLLRTSHANVANVYVTYAPHDTSFFRLGDIFGDCTAGRVRNQVDPRVANIHETVYSWFLDPFYRVLLVWLDGEPVLKGHVLPLLVGEQPVLAIDAIEAVPKIRRRVRGTRNEHISERVYARREEAMATLIESTKIIAGRMGLQKIYADKFSNALWVREFLDRFPSEWYHVGSVVKPFDKKPIASAVGVSSQIDIFEEVQFFNLDLWDQQLAVGFKEVSVVEGVPRGFRIPCRGP